MVHVTDIQATLIARDNEKVVVDYTLSNAELELCRKITQQFRRYLNGMLEGLVNFEIDEYFTAATVTEENISHSYGDAGIAYGVIANNLPEMSGKLSDYQSVMTTINLNDTDYKLHNSLGIAGSFYGCVYLESVLESLISQGISIEELFDTNHSKWNSIMEPFIHEFIHTIELRINAFEFHKVLEYDYVDGALKKEKLYLLGQALKNGNLVGIPYSFWKGDIAKLNYIAEEGGYMIGLSTQEVAYGADALSITATASEGYEFVEWSDGVKTPTRTDKNVWGDITVTAIFRKMQN